MARITHRVVFVVTGLVIMVVLHVLMVIWVLFRARRPSRPVAEHADEEGSGGGGGGGAGLSAEEVGELPCHEFKEGADGGGGGDCAVCLEAFRAGDRRRVLPGCGHGFHAACVDSWLRKSRRCPICRAEVVAQRKDAGAVAAAGTVEIVTESNHANCE